LHAVENFKKVNSTQSLIEILNLKNTALSGENIFEALMSASRHCSLFQMSQALYEVGGQYRRNL
jgi:isobutyryl-CoA mutase